MKHAKNRSNNAGICPAAILAASIILTAFLAASSASAQTVLTLNTNDMELCPCSTERIYGTLQATQPGTYTLDSDSSWATVVPATVTLKAGEKENIYIYVTPDCFTEPGMRTLKINAESASDSASSAVDVNVLECHGISLVPDSAKKTACTGDEAAFDISLTNTGKVRETFRLSSDKGTIAPAEISLDSGQTKNAELIVAANDAVQKIAATAESGSSYAKKTIALELSGENCYSSELSVLPTAASACQGLSAAYAISLKNTGSREDTYTLSSDFGGLGENNILLKAGEKKSITLDVSAANKSIGEHKFYISYKSGARQQIKQSNEAMITIENCYHVEVLPENSILKVCPGAPATYVLSVKNTGKLADNYTIRADDGELSEEFLPLAAGGKKDVFLLVETALNESEERRITASADSDKSNATVMLKLAFEKFEKCYDFEISAEPKTMPITNRSKGLVLLKIKNTGMDTLKFTLKLEGPAWVYLDPQNMEIPAGEVREAYLYAAPLYETADGEYPVKVQAENTGKMSKETRVMVAVGNATNIKTANDSKSTPTGEALALGSSKKIVYAIIIGAAAIAGIIFLPDLLWRKKEDEEPKADFDALKCEISPAAETETKGAPEKENETHIEKSDAGAELFEEKPKKEKKKRGRPLKKKPENLDEDFEAEGTV